MHRSLDLTIVYTYISAISNKVKNVPIPPDSSVPLSRDHSFAPTHSLISVIPQQVFTILGLHNNRLMQYTLLIYEYVSRFFLLFVFFCFEINPCCGLSGFGLRGCWPREWAQQFVPFYFCVAFLCVTAPLFVHPFFY